MLYRLHSLRGSPYAQPDLGSGKQAEWPHFTWQTERLGHACVARLYSGARAIAGYWPVWWMADTEARSSLENALLAKHTGLFGYRRVKP